MEHCYLEWQRWNYCSWWILLRFVAVTEIEVQEARKTKQNKQTKTYCGTYSLENQWCSFKNKYMQNVWGETTTESILKLFEKILFPWLFCWSSSGEHLFWTQYIKETRKYIANFSWWRWNALTPNLRDYDRKEMIYDTVVQLEGSLWERVVACCTVRK